LYFLCGRDAHPTKTLSNLTIQFKCTTAYDRFYVMKYVNKELNKIRRQSKIKGKGSRFIVRRNDVDLKEEERIKLATVLSQSKRLKLAYELKE
jgi:transposase